VYAETLGTRERERKRDTEREKEREKKRKRGKKREKHTKILGATAGTLGMRDKEGGKKSQRG